MEMEKRIELEKKASPIPAEEMVELIVEDCHSKEIHGLTDEFKNLESLSLKNVGLTTLKGFPSLPRLRNLELAGNQLSGTFNFLSGCIKLSFLSLSKNPIIDVETLEPLKDLPQLKRLDLFDCDVTKTENYRKRVFEILPNISYLDELDRNDKKYERPNGDFSDKELDEDDDELGVDDDNSEDDEDCEDEVGLSYLQKSGLDDDSDGEEFVPHIGEEEDEDGDEDEDADDDDDGEDDEEMMENVGDNKLSPAAAAGNDEFGRGIKRKRTADDIEISTKHPDIKTD